MSLKIQMRFQNQELEAVEDLSSRLGSKEELSKFNYLYSAAQYDKAFVYIFTFTIKSLLCKKRTFLEKVFLKLFNVFMVKREKRKALQRGK